MPAYNASMFIEESIRSVLHQTYKRWELIIVDDGSIDATGEIVKQYLNCDSRIKYIYQNNKRLGGARNTGINASNGEWLAFLDSDDLWTCDKLEKQIQALNKHKDVDVIFTDGYIFFDNDLKKHHPYPTIYGKFTGKEIYNLQYVQNYIPVLSVIFKKSFVEIIGLQDQNKLIHGCEDWDYWIRLAKEGAIFLGLEDKLFYYRRHTFNMSSNLIQMQMAEAFVYIKNFDKNYLSNDFISKKFQLFLVPLVEELLLEKKMDEARFLIYEYARIVPNTFQIINKVMITILGKNAYYPYKLMRKINEKFNS